MSGFSYALPRTLEDAIALLDVYSGEAHLLAGGTALALLQKQDLIEPGLIVDLGGVPGLDGIAVADDGALWIGAMRTLRRLEVDPLVRRHQPTLASAVGRVASVRVRNQATLGGNLAHANPAHDPPPVLLALDAMVVVVGADGSRTLPLDGFFIDVFETVLAPGEILTAIVVPATPPCSRLAYEKFLPRTVDDYATVSVAARLDVRGDGTVADARLAFGAIASVPLRVRSAEALLRGRNATDIDYVRVAEAVRTAVNPVDDLRGSADYKREMAGVWTTRVLRRLLGPGVARR